MPQPPANRSVPVNPLAAVGPSTPTSSYVCPSSKKASRQRGVCVNHLNRCKTSTLIDGIAFPYQVLCHEYFTRRLSNLLFICRGQGLQWLPCPTKLCHWRGSNWGRPVVYLQIAFNCWTRCPLRCYSFSGRILLHCFSRLVIHHFLSGLLECFFLHVRCIPHQ